VRRVLPLALLCAAAFAPPPARADDSDAFAGKVQPVSGQLYRKAGRFELTPAVGLSLNDAFFTKVLLGAKATWHFSEWLALTGSFAGGFASPTGSTEVCPANQGCHPAFKDQLAAVPGEIKTIGGLEVGFSPVYAKVNLLAEKVGHFDLSLLAGADRISYREVLAPPSSPGSPVGTGTKAAFGGHAGLGARLFFADWGALRLEFKDYLYFVKVSGSTKLEQQLLVETGLSVFFPLRNRGP
jgi:outer membrane beta-barrel protein